MNCTHMRQVLDAYIDHELDAATSADISQHLAACLECAALRAERDALRRTLRGGAVYHTAPASLQRHIERFQGSTPRVPVSGNRPGWLAASAMTLCAALIGLLGGYWLARPQPEPLWPDQVIASHVASLSDARLTHVAASDRHVIKPWFQGKIDFAPAVRDLSAAGFTLAGARLDHVADRQAAAVIYRIRNHIVNVYSWRAQSTAAEAPTLTTVRGFAMVTWSSGGLRYTAVSDVDARDLKQLATLLSTP